MEICEGMDKCFHLGCLEGLDEGKEDFGPPHIQK